MFGLAWSTLRARMPGFIGAFVALWCAAAVVAACGVLLETGLRGEVQPQRYAGVPIVVAGDQLVYETIEKKDDKVKVKAKPVAERVGIDRDLADDIAAVPGVDTAVPEVSFPAHVVAGDGLVPGADSGPSWGHGWSSAAITPMRLRAGTAPELAADVVVDAELAARAGLSAGDVVTVAASGTPTEYRVTGIAAPPEGDGLHGQSALYFTDDRAEQLSGRPGQAVAIGVLVDAGARPQEVAAEIDSRLTAIVGEQNVVVGTGAERGTIEFLQAEQARIRLISLGGAIGGTSLLVAVLVVVGTFALQLQQRRREFALLRAVAATPRQIRRMAGIEAITIGIVAGVLGATAGLGLAVLLRGVLIRVGVLPEILEPVISPLPVFAAVVVTVVSAWVAAQVSVRRSVSIAPTVALGESAVDARVPVIRVILGLAAVVGYVVLLVLLARLDSEAAATPVTFLSVVLAVVAVGLLAPLLTWAAAAAAAVPLRLSGLPSGYLAAESLRTRWGRAAAVVTPLCLMVAMTCTVLFLPTTLAAAGTGQVDDARTDGYVVVSTGLGVPQEAIGDLSAVEGVTAVTGQLTSSARAGLTQYPIQGLSVGSLTQTVDLDIRSGSMSALADDTVAVSERFARNQGVAVGDTIALTLGDRTSVSLDVIAVYARGLGFGDVTLTSERLAPHVDNPLPRTVFVASSRDDLAGELSAAVAGYPGVSVLDGRGFEVAQQQRDADSARTNIAIMAPIVAFALVAAVNTLATATSQRVHELGLLRRIGATRGQLRRALRWEVIVIGLLGITLGVGVALATLTALGSGMAAGAGVTLSVPTLGLVVASALGVTVVTTAVAARSALRTRPGASDG